MPLKPVQIGYLRDAAPYGSSPVQTSVPGKGMLRKLALAGYTVEVVRDKTSLFARTEQGQAEIEDFDRNLRSGPVAVLNAIQDPERGVLDPDFLRRGITRLVDAGLVRISRFGPKPSFALTFEGERVRNLHAGLARINQAGPQAEQEQEQTLPGLR